ncbi:MAG: hypothetical protein RL297_289 [Pseudomonadota bacterium]|jgi:hypothetical protein
MPHKKSADGRFFCGSAAVVHMGMPVGLIQPIR